MQKRRVVIDLLDDIDGSANAQTITFGIDGRVYEIELAPKNETRLRKALAPFIESAREKRSRRRRTKHGDPAEVRAWAAENGVEVNTHGRVPQAVTEQYERAQLNGDRR